MKSDNQRTEKGHEPAGAVFVVHTLRAQGCRKDTVLADAGIAAASRCASCSAKPRVLAHFSDKKGERKRGLDTGAQTESAPAVASSVLSGAPRFADRAAHTSPGPAEGRRLPARRTGRPRC